MTLIHQNTYKDNKLNFGATHSLQRLNFYEYR